MCYQDINYINNYINRKIFSVSFSISFLWSLYILTWTTANYFYTIPIESKSESQIHAVNEEGKSRAVRDEFSSKSYHHDVPVKLPCQFLNRKRSALYYRCRCLCKPGIIIFIGCYRARNATAEQFTFPLMVRSFLSMPSRKDRETSPDAAEEGARKGFVLPLRWKGGSPIAKPSKRCRGQSLIIRVYYEPRNQSVACNYVSIPSTYFVTLQDAFGDQKGTPVSSLYVRK